MAVIIVLSLAVCVSLITIVFGCLVCRRKLSEQEIQRKAFEKFRKRHMLHQDRILSSRVDYVRSVSEGKSGSHITGFTDHTYEEMSTPPIPHPPVIQVQEPSPILSSDYSFFDDSFQTVIEASSSNMSSSNSGTTNLLTVSREHQASYISLQAGNSHTCLKTAVEDSSVESEGEINPGFSDGSSSTGGHRGSSDSLTDSYIVPSCGPKIKVIHPSMKKKFDMSVPLTNIQTYLSSGLHAPVGNTELNISDPRNSYRKFSDSSQSSHVESKKDNDMSEDFHDNTRTSEHCYNGNQMLRQKSLQKLEIEGPTYGKSLSLDYIDSSNYEKLQGTRHEKSVYKSLQKRALILPGRPRMCSPLTSPESSEEITERSVSENSAVSSKHAFTDLRSSAHSYESINSILACEMNRRDSVASVEHECVSVNSSLRQTSKSTQSRAQNSGKQNDLSYTSPNHTYESIKSKVRAEVEKSEIACENSAVIIGRRVSNPFDSKKVSKRMINKKKQKSIKNTVNQSDKNASKDSEERYSPFPSSKKLAFKSAFKQVSSPRFSVIKTVTGNMNSQLMFKQEMCPDSLNIKTPEIKVDNCPQFFDNTAYISPKLLNRNSVLTESESHKDTIDMISSVHTYLSLKDCISSKISNNNLQTSLTEKRQNYRKSLPSLSDHLEQDLVKHCNTNMFSRSTPCELDQGGSSFF